MSFMEPQITEKTDGVQVGDSIFDTVLVPDGDQDNTDTIYGAEQGYGARLSAPGYLDCTE